MLKSVSNETFNKCFFMVSKETFQNKRFINILKMFNLKRFFWDGFETKWNVSKTFHVCWVTRSVQRGVQRGAFSPTSGATPATPTLGATPKFLSATPKDFVPSEKAKRSLLLLQNIWSISIWKGGKLKKLHVPRSGASFYNVQCICSEIVLLVIAKITYYQSANLCSAFRYAFF